MSRSNFFISYHHCKEDCDDLQLFREQYGGKSFSDFAFGNEDLSDASRLQVLNKIKVRLWASSVTIILVGEETGNRPWVDWEIWYSLQEYRNNKFPKRSFKPKGLLAIFLDRDRHSVPARLQQNLESGYAVQMNWDQLNQESLERSMEQAKQNRLKKHLISADIARFDSDPFIRTLDRNRLVSLTLMEYWQAIFGNLIHF